MKLNVLCPPDFLVVPGLEVMHYLDDIMNLEEINGQLENKCARRLKSAQ